MKITKKNLKRLIKEISDDVDRSNVPQRYRRSERELAPDHPQYGHGTMRLPRNLKRQRVLDEIQNKLNDVDKLMEQLWALEQYRHIEKDVE